MRHPLAGKNLRYYGILWAVIFIAHILFIHLFLNYELSIALTDSLIFNGLVAGFALTYWYVVKFLPPETTNFINLILSHLIGIAFLISIILFLTYSLLNRLFEREEYVLFLDETFLWRAILSFFYLVLVVMIYYLLQYKNTLQQKEQEEMELQNLLKNAELEMLKFQLNPHFIFNSLNSISSLTITKPEKAQEMVIKLSEFLRSSLGKQETKMHTLESEFKQINLYLEIEKVRFGDRLSVEQKIDEECKNYKIPHLILQPVYENAIKFGVYEQLDQVFIHTTCTRVGDNLIIEVKNNFENEHAPVKGKGIGLNNIRKRMNLLYGRNDLVEVIIDRSIFTVKLTIPQNV
ncbi:MAG: sensor histidine kinase [Candidatus Cyclobacteriaceae bacterium M2_1C_046]